MGYTHHDRISGVNGLAVGAKGSETVVADSSGALYQKGTEITATAAELNKMDGITASTAELNSVFLTVKMTDVSTSGSVYVVSPVAGTLSKAYSVIDGAIATADAVLTLNVNGGDDITNKITITQSGSGAGDVDSCTPNDNNTVAVGNYIKITTNGASTNTVAATITLVITL